MKNKKMYLLIIAAVMLFSFSSVCFADEEVKDYIAVEPILYDTDTAVVISAEAEELVSYKIDVENELFTIILKENPTTGYAWVYTINDRSTDEEEYMVKALEDGYIEPGNGVLGEGGEHVFNFKAEKDGVSSITFEYKRSWENDAIDTIQFLVYMKEGKLIVDIDGEVKALDETEQAENEAEFEKQREEGTIGIAMPDAEIDLYEDGEKQAVGMNDVEIELYEDAKKPAADTAVTVSEDVDTGFFRKIIEFFRSIFAAIFGK